MQENKIHILATRQLSTKLLDEITDADILVDVVPFIDTVPIQTIEVQQEIEQAYLLSTTVVFTSMNAVEAVATWQYDQQPEWIIYCTGATTRKLAGEYFGEEKIAGTADSAAELAELIIESGETDDVIFFCGNQRRDELPEILQREGINVQEIIVYETIQLPVKITKSYHGVVFFSPSAVTSFFKNNKLPDRTIVFAIGGTTANEIKTYSTNKIIIAEEASAEGMVRSVLEYFGHY